MFYVRTRIAFDLQTGDTRVISRLGIVKILKADTKPQTTLNPRAIEFIFALKL